MEVVHVYVAPVSPGPLVRWICMAERLGDGGAIWRCARCLMDVVAVEVYDQIQARETCRHCGAAVSVLAVDHQGVMDEWSGARTSCRASLLPAESVGRSAR